MIQIVQTYTKIVDSDHNSVIEEMIIGKRKRKSEGKNKKEEYRRVGNRQRKVENIEMR